MKPENTGLSASQLSHLIDEWIIGNNAERDREILKEKLINGKSLYQLSDMFNLSLTQIKNILRKRQNELFKHL